MADKTNANIGFERQLWDAACVLWGHTPEIGTAIDNAMRAIEAENKKLKNVFPKNYASPDLDKRVLGEVVDIFTNNIDMSDTMTKEERKALKQIALDKDITVSALIRMRLQEQQKAEVKE